MIPDAYLLSATSFGLAVSSQVIIDLYLLSAVLQVYRSGDTRVWLLSGDTGYTYIHLVGIEDNALEVYPCGRTDTVNS